MSPKKKSQKAPANPPAMSGKNVGGQKKGSSGTGGKKKSSAGGKLLAILIVILLLAGVLVVFNKLDACSIIRDITGCGGGPAASDSDTGDKQPDSYTVPDSTVEDIEVDNSSDASILSMFTSCAPDDDSENDNNDRGRYDDISGSDSGAAVSWEHPENDAAYNGMMKDKTSEFITLFTQLEDMRSELSECKSTAQVENNERYIALRAKLMGWCSGAQNFDASDLGERSREASEIAERIAEDTSDYLDIYPTYVCSPESVKSDAEDLQTSIIEAMLRLNDIITAE